MFVNASQKLHKVVVNYDEAKENREDNTSTYRPKLKATQGLGVLWTFVRNFDNESDAKMQLKSENWIIETMQTKGRQKSYFPLWTNEVWVPDHSKIIEPRGLSAAEKCTVNELMELRLKPKMMSETLEQEGLKIPVMQLNNYLVAAYQEYMTDLSWTSLEQYEECVSSIWQIVFDRENWKSSTCTCSVYLKQYICKHIVAISYINDRLEIPLGSKDVSVGKNKRRGRPASAKRALLMN